MIFHTKAAAITGTTYGNSTRPPHECPAAERFLQRQRRPESHEDRQDRAEDRVHERGAQHRPEVAGADHRLVVLKRRIESDEAHLADVDEAGLLEAEGDVPQHREDDRAGRPPAPPAGSRPARGGPRAWPFRRAGDVADAAPGALLRQSGCRSSCPWVAVGGAVPGPTHSLASRRLLEEGLLFLHELLHLGSAFFGTQRTGEHLVERLWHERGSGSGRPREPPRLRRSPSGRSCWCLRSTR